MASDGQEVNANLLQCMSVVIFVSPEHPSGFRIDQVQPRAPNAGAMMTALAIVKMDDP